MTLAMAAAIPLSLWAVSQPLVVATLLGTAVVASLAARQGMRLARCFRECGGFSLDLGGRVRIHVTRPRVDTQE